MIVTMDQIRNADNLDLGVSEWFTVEQDLIDKFSDLTTDDQWIHVDVERATAGPFGAPIAHGYLVASLISQFLDELLVVPDRSLTVNYGIDRLRFTGPVKAGSRIRMHMSIPSVKIKGDAVVASLDLKLESEGVDKPALVGTALFQFS
jgi:acyl dehydratase